MGLAMKRVAIVGCSGGGKSTLAVRLGERLGLPVIHLDTLFWRPGWVESEPLAFRERLREALAAPAWISDGNFMATADLRLPLADTIVWVDQPRLTCLWRALLRLVAWTGRSRPDLAPGCPERFDMEFLRYIWNWDRVTRPRVQQAIERFGGRARLVRLRSDREIAGFLGRAA
jgi:adenylate kinase family enzyme